MQAPHGDHDSSNEKNRKLIEIHSTARVSPLADIEPSIRGTRVVVGPHSIIDSFVKVKPVGGTGDVIIGKRSFINSGCVLYSGNGIRIGDGVLIAANCTLAAVNHAFDALDIPIIDQRFQPSRGGIVIENNVWIGANSVLLDGAVIRSGVVVAAGSLVRGELLSGGLYGGNPASLIRQRGR